MNQLKTWRCEKQWTLAHQSYPQPSSSSQTPFPAPEQGNREGERERGEEGGIGRTPNLPERLHATPFVSLLAKNSISSLSHIMVPIKDNNILSLRFLLELNQIVHFRICYLPSCITWLHVWFVTWSIKLFPAQPLQSWDTCIFFTWKLGDFESTSNSYNQ